MHTVVVGSDRVAGDRSGDLALLMSASTLGSKATFWDLGMAGHGHTAALLPQLGTPIVTHFRVTQVAIPSSTFPNMLLQLRRFLFQRDGKTPEWEREHTGLWPEVPVPGTDTGFAWRSQREVSSRPFLPGLGCKGSLHIDMELLMLLLSSAVALFRNTSYLSFQPYKMGIIRKYCLSGLAD